MCVGGDPRHPDTCFDKCGDGFNVGPPGFPVLTYPFIAPNNKKYCDDGNRLNIS